MTSPPNLDLLNPQQRAAVQCTQGPLLLLAGAGTGKTRVIIHRIAHILAEGVCPDHMLAVTFTNKAAREMQERVADLIDEDRAGRVSISTFHSFCCGLLRQYIGRLGYTPGFSIANQSYQIGLIRNIMAESGYTREGCDPFLWLHMISGAKSRMETPADMAGADHPNAAAIAHVYEQYQARMKAMDQLDFDDLLLLTHRLWQDHDEVLQAQRDRYRYIMIDEYQDTNLIQFHLMATLAMPRNNLCVVGDDDQSIYGWRGANLGNILQFETHFPEATVIRLEQNYRSTTTILEAANHLISHNAERRAKRLWSDRDHGDRIKMVRAADEKDEARFVAEYLFEGNVRGELPWSDAAVLFRSNHQSRMLEQTFRDMDVPYTLVGATSFFQRKEILDAISFLQALNNPRDDQSLLRILNVPPRGIGTTSMETLKHSAGVLHKPISELMASEAALDRVGTQARESLRKLHACFEQHRNRLTQAGPLHEKVRRFLTDIGYLEGLGKLYKPREDALKRRDNVLEFINAVAEFEKDRANATLGDFLEECALLDARDREEQGAGTERGVTLMTAHASKGLEFPLVIIIGLERGVFPHRRALEERNEAEERRLFYVAMTRAQTELILTYAEQRKRQGRTRRQRPSGFLDELPDQLVELTTPKDAIRPAAPDVADDFMDQLKALAASPGRHNP